MGRARRAEMITATTIATRAAAPTPSRSAVPIASPKAAVTVVFIIAPIPAMPPGPPMACSNAPGAARLTPAATVIAPAAATSRLPRPAGASGAVPGRARSSAILRETEANASHRLDVAGSRGIVAELAAKVGNMDVEDVVVAEEVDAPDGIDQLLAGEDHARLSNERGQEVEFECGQVDKLTRPPGGATSRIHDQVRCPQRRSLPGRRRRAGGAAAAHGRGQPARAGRTAS